MSSQVSELPRRGLNPRQAETVERLLLAGLEELRAVGHEALTVRTVAHRAGVSPATAYTYLASKNHLFAELFLRHLTQGPPSVPSGGPTADRVRDAVRNLTEQMLTEPALTAAVTPALLGTDPDVERLRLRIGSEIVARFSLALTDPATPNAPFDPTVLDVLVLTFTGALLQLGIGVLTHDELTERLEACVTVILRGNS